MSEERITTNFPGEPRKNRNLSDMGYYYITHVCYNCWRNYDVYVPKGTYAPAKSICKYCECNTGGRP